MSAGLPDEDLGKLQYALDMSAAEHQFDEAGPLEQAVLEASSVPPPHVNCFIFFVAHWDTYSLSSMSLASCLGHRMEGREDARGGDTAM